MLYLDLVDLWYWQVSSVQSPTSIGRDWEDCIPERWWEDSRCGLLFHDGLQLTSFQVLTLNVEITEVNYKITQSKPKSKFKIRSMYSKVPCLLVVCLISCYASLIYLKKNFLKPLHILFLQRLNFSHITISQLQILRFFSLYKSIYTE
jgi:hypothetical protein